ncbi:MAG: prepilin-type N-terminal cleavage/methylation domain-containing protein [Clostridiales bacterium]|nr:prepilin-type N-terminal cleavage/methylation domain-containing protein [Clostridiales bacterium]
MEKMIRSRKGMSLAELLLVIAIGAIITVAVVAVLVSLFQDLPWEFLE